MQSRIELNFENKYHIVQNLKYYPYKLVAKNKSHQKQHTVPKFVWIEHYAYTLIAKNKSHQKQHTFRKQITIKNDKSH